MINAPIPESVIQQREGGGKTVLSYISGATVTDMLNTIFDFNWDWDIKETWVQKSEDKYNKYKDEMQKQPPVAHVKGQLIVRFVGDDGKDYTITKMGLGSKVFIGGATEQESAFKAADTDALKKAASRLGIGTELYRNEQEQEYYDYINDPWTDEMLAKYREVRENIKQIKDQNALSSEKLDELFLESGLGQSMENLEPYNIEDFYAFLKKTFAPSPKKQLTKAK